jgi:hypothetical protein
MNCFWQSIKGVLYDYRALSFLNRPLYVLGLDLLGTE